MSTDKSPLETDSTSCLLCEAASFSFAWAVLELLALRYSRPQAFHCDHRAHKPCCLIIVKTFLICFLHSTWPLILWQSLLSNTWKTG